MPLYDVQCYCSPCPNTVILGLCFFVDAVNNFQTDSLFTIVAKTSFICKKLCFVNDGVRQGVRSLGTLPRQVEIDSSIPWMCVVTLNYLNNPQETTNQHKPAAE